MSRRALLLCVLLGCAPAPLGPASPVEPSSIARAEASRGEGDAASDPAPVSEAPAPDPSPGEGDVVAPEPDDVAPSEPGSPEDPAPVAEPTQGPLVIEDEHVPKFARIDFSPRTLGKQRIRILYAGMLYTPSSLAPLTDDEKRDHVSLEVRVLDGDATGDPRRPRVLCEDQASRLGVAVDVEDLSTAVRTWAFVGPKVTPTDRPTPKTPGLRLAGGAGVRVLGESSDGTTRIAYHGLFLVAEGYVVSDALDVVYTPSKLEDDSRRNGRLRSNVRFLDAPNGFEIARTARPPDVTNTMDVFRLGPEADDHVLVRYQEREAFVIGWVPSEAVEARKTERLRYGRGSGSGFGGRASNLIELARGTRLVPTTSDEVIGVVTKDHSLPCVLDCDGPNPHVRLRACSRMLTLRAVP